MQVNFEAGSGKTHNSSEFSSNAKRDAADILTHLKQSYDLEPNQVMSKLFELFTRTLTHLKDPKVFDHWLQYLLSVHGSIDLCEGVQLNRTEDSKNVIEFDGESENAAEVLYAAYHEYVSLERPLNEEFYAVQLEEITLKAQRLEQKLLEKKISEFRSIFNSLSCISLRNSRDCVEVAKGDPSTDGRPPEENQKNKLFLFCERSAELSISSGVL